MNYLVHLYLAGSDPMCRLGAIMGDFVKGRLPETYPPGILKGLQHHRRIDSLAQVSQYTRSSRQRLNPRFGHARAILVDIFYDHLLARSWDRFSAQPLESFAEEVYALLATQRALLPPELQEITPRMTSHNWLVSYREQVAVGRALSWIASRLSRNIPLAEAVDELSLHGDALQQDLEGFMQEAKERGQEEFGINLQELKP